MSDEAKTPKKEDKPKAEDEYNKRSNPWMYATVILAIVAIVAYALPSSGMITADTGQTDTLSFQSDIIPRADIGEIAVNFFNTMLSETPGSLAGVEEVSGVYEVMISIQGQNVPLYFTKDGYWIGQGRELLSTTELPDTTPEQPSQPTDSGIPKSDKPVVELFVMSHCPYGTQAEKGMIPVFELLGDKIDSSIKFVYYAMHPSQGEVQEQLNQYCIQEEQNDKYLDYLACFLEAGDTQGCIDRVGVDRNALDTCYTANDEKYQVTTNLEDQSAWLNGRFPQFNIHLAENQKYGVGGSPTLVINGQTVSSGRDSASFLSVVCSAFDTPPEECSTQLSSASPSPGFGYVAGTAATDAQCG